ncbi:MAG: ATP-binding protein [Phycisphaerae bacterium]
MPAAKRFSTERKIIAAFTGAFAVLCIMALISINYINTLLRNWDDVSHSHAVLDEIAVLQRNIFQLPERGRNFSAHPGQTTFDEFQGQVEEARDSYRRLLRLTADDPQQQKNLKEFYARFNDVVNTLKIDSDPAAVGDFWTRSPLRSSSQFILFTIDEEHRLLDARDMRTRRTSRVALVTIAAAGLLAAIIIVAFAVTIIRDLKQRRRDEIELQRARQSAEAANVAKSAFLANISHELRTPLTSILGYTDLLMVPGENGSDQTRYLATMRRSGEHLLNIINDVLDLSKIEAGRMELELLDCRLVDVFADVDSLMRPRAVTKGIRFSVDYISPLPERVLTDPTRLRQVLVNLVSNAVKFTEEGEVRIRVRHESQPNASRLVVDVADTGIGITPEQREALFKPFTQADVTTTRRYGGTGLGLSISQRLAEMLGGSLRCSSEPAKGSVFTFSMPVTPAKDSPMLEPAEMLRLLAAVKPVNGQLRAVAARVLLAEDGVEAREVLTLHLERAGCTVASVPDGLLAVDQTLDAARQGTPFDVVLMDMQMPVMDGYSATSRLRAQGYKGAIIALTANAMKEDRERCIRAGCDEYLPKPVEIPALLATIERFSSKPATNHRPVAPALLEDPVLLKLTLKFVETLPALLETFHRQIKTGALKELAAAAHKLAGAAGSYGFQDLFREAKSLERLAKEAASTEDLRKQCERLQTTCEAARSALSAATG